MTEICQYSPSKESNERIVVAVASKKVTRAILNKDLKAKGIDTGPKSEQAVV